MQRDLIQHVRDYYAAGLDKNFIEMERYLHPDVRFIAPLATLNGKEDVVNAAKGFFTIVKTMDFRSCFSQDDKVMIAYDAIFPEPIGRLPSALLCSFENGLMKTMELFYDPRPILSNQDKIFKK